MNHIDKKIRIAERRILELNKAGDLKKIDQGTKHLLCKFYKEKCTNRLESACIILSVSKDVNLKDMMKVFSKYTDYSEVISCAYYAMYYIVHAYLAVKYRTRLKEDTRGVHAITHHLILYYLVKTKRLATYLYEEYIKTLETTTKVNKIVEDFQDDAYKYAERYERTRSARETFTYKVSLNAERLHAEHAVNSAREFINTVKILMV